MKCILLVLLIVPFVRASESLAINDVNKIFSPILAAMAAKDYSSFVGWFEKHSIINDAIKKQIESYVENVVRAKISIYGKVIQTRLVKNSILDNKYGTLVVIQDYESLFLIWRFNYYKTQDGQLNLKGFSVDSDIDVNDLFNERLSSNGVVLDVAKGEFVP